MEVKKTRADNSPKEVKKVEDDVKSQKK